MTFNRKSTNTLAAALPRTFGLIAMASALIVGAAILAPAAEARSLCVPHDKLVNQLSKRHGEKSVAMGLASNGSLMQVFSSKEGGTWTMVLTKPNGESCIMAAGESWMDVPKQLAGDIS